jgi:hypothetical protein
MLTVVCLGVQPPAVNLSSFTDGAAEFATDTVLHACAGGKLTLTPVPAHAVWS